MNGYPFQKNMSSGRRESRNSAESKNDDLDRIGKNDKREGPPDNLHSSDECVISSSLIDLYASERTGLWDGPGSW